MPRLMLTLLSFAVLAVGQNLSDTTPKFPTLSIDTWPNDSDWASLNNTLGGRLEALRPWAAVCYTSDPLYNAEECQSVLSGYKNDTQREAAPGARLWQNWESCGYGQGCPIDYANPQPVSGETCYQGAIPPYTISISDAHDASIVTKWATAHNVKLTIKNTGHDYQGRSAAPSTLQVDTHLMDSLRYLPEFVPQGSNVAPVPALEMGAGAQISNIYDYAATHDFTPVIGVCLTVGVVGGFLQGGGHGILTPAYGLGADNILQFEVVTADGQIRVVNEAQDSDLFWALRGGGAGSWGIVTSAIIKVYPPVSIGASRLVIIPNASQDADTLGIKFLNLVAKYSNDWLDSGITTTVVAFQNQYLLFLYWPTNFGDLSDLFSFFEDLKSLSGNYTVASNTTSSSMYPTVSAAILEDFGPFFDTVNPYGAANILSSRLVPKSYLHPSNLSSIMQVSSAIWQGLQIVNDGSNGKALLSSLPVVILGDMPGRAAAKGVNSTGANPGLYEAAWHVAYTAPWSLAALDASVTSDVMTAVHDAVAPMTALGIRSSYQNEGDPFEKDWMEAFFGYKYPELLSIKQKYDPANFFTSYKGVGSMTDLPAYRCYAAQAHELHGNDTMLVHPGGNALSCFQGGICNLEDPECHCLI